MTDEKIIFEFADGSGYYRWCGENLSGSVIHRTKSPMDADDFSWSKPPNFREKGKFIRVTFEPTFYDAEINEKGFFVLGDDEITDENEEY